MTEKQIHLIVNPTSGYGSGNMLVAELKHALSAQGWEWQEFVTCGPGDATQRASQAAGNVRAVIAFGGDGTVREVADGLMGSETPMLIAPSGTENLMAKLLGIRNRPPELLSILDNEKTARFDLGVVNDRSFHTTLGIGFDAEVVRRLTQMRDGHISHLSYFWPIWHTLWTHAFPHIRIVADGEEVFNEQGTAFVANSSRYGGGLGVCPVAQPDDGLLNLVAFPACNRKQLLMWWGRMIAKRSLRHKRCVHLKFKKAHIEWNPNTTCQIDGDVGPVGPLDISLHAEPIRLLVPPSYQGAST